MGQARRLLRSISPGALQLAKVSAAKRWRVYLHASARKRLVKQEQALLKSSAAQG